MELTPTLATRIKNQGMHENNNGMNGIYSMSVTTSYEERLAAYYYTSWQGFSLA